MSIKYDKKRKKYRASIGSGLDRHRRDFDTKTDALSWEAQQKCVRDDSDFEKLDSSLDSLLDDYIESLKSCVKNHQNDALYTLKNFFKSYKLKTLLDLKSKHLENFKLKSGYSLPTVNRKIGFVKAFSSFTCKHGYLKSDPFESVDKLKRRKKQKKKERVLSQLEISKIFEIAQEEDPEFLPILIFFLNTGCRLSELVTLEWDDIKFQSRKVRFWDKPHLLVRNEPYTCKWDSQRIFPMNQIVYNSLTELSQPKGFVFFPEKDRNRLGDYIYRRFKRLLKNLEIDRPKEIKIHTFRHTWISHMLATGASLPEVSRLAGHSNLTTTQEYAHLISGFETLKSTVDQMPNFGSKEIKRKDEAFDIIEKD